MVLIHTRFALQLPLQFCKRGFSRLSCCSKTPLENLPRHVSRIAVLSWSSKFAKYTSVIAVLLGKKYNIITPFAFPKYCGHRLSSRWLCLELFWPQALPTDDSELYSLARNNEPKSHLQSPDARQKNHLFT